MKTTLYLLVACLFSACSTVEYIEIETYNPAGITFPKNVGKVLVVNNAVPQPDDVGYTYKIRLVPVRIALCMMFVIPWANR